MVFKDYVYLKKISMGEESSQPTNNANKINISIFWLWKSQFLTHTVDMYESTVFPRCYAQMFCISNAKKREDISGKVFL